MGIHTSGSAAAAVADRSVCQGRLTLTSGTPVTTSDVTAATTLYFTPFNGNLVGLFDGSSWSIEEFTERSIAIPATTGTNYDVFLYDNAGTLTLSLTAWSNDTTRATALVAQDGIYVKSGATTYRYLGTVRTTGVAGQTEDSEANRFVWNYYHRVERTMVVQEATNSWTYGTATWRSANNSATNRLQFVIGINDAVVVATVLCSADVTNGATPGAVGIALDATNANHALLFAELSHGTASSTVRSTVHAKYMGYCGIGYHYLQWVENSRAGVNVTYNGDLGQPTVQSGIIGLISG